ncbi:hypothetical protein [Pedobacter frigiditerrae]|uniref:hypothetical protein n=1 Tax=Pedobacter frigiditerrae TaxID=2530452 RepID=UPI0029306B51|nr:hypothetical protein [Pedobacter frigiditerrae]
MKTLAIFILIIGIGTSSCSAQKKIASIDNNVTLKADLENYTVKKQQKKATIENTKNKLGSVRQVSPNLPINISLRPYYIKLDLQQLTKILAINIPLKELESLASNKNAGISIDLRTELTGRVLEVSFFTDENSILNLKQLELIESEIKEAKLVTVKPEIEKYIRGSNFLLVDTRIVFEDILKAKKTM